MANSPTERAELLAAWLGKAVASLLEQGGAVAAALVATCGGRKAIIKIDDAVLRLHAQPQDGGLQLFCEALQASAMTDFETDARALRDVLSGQVLLDSAIVEGRIRVAAPLADLLAMHNLVMQALACGPIQPTLRDLWQQFDAQWPESSAGRAAGPLDGQRPRHGMLPGSVPSDVLEVRPAGPGSRRLDAH